MKKQLKFIPKVGLKVKLNGNPFDEQIGGHGDQKTVQTITEVRPVDYVGTSGFWLKTDLYHEYLDAAWFEPVPQHSTDCTCKDHSLTCGFEKPYCCDNCPMLKEEQPSPVHGKPECTCCCYRWQCDELKASQHECIHCQPTLQTDFNVNSTDFNVGSMETTVKSTVKETEKEEVRRVA